MMKIYLKKTTQTRLTTQLNYESQLYDNMLVVGVLHEIGWCFLMIFFLFDSQVGDDDADKYDNVLSFSFRLGDSFIYFGSIRNHQINFAF